MNKETALKSPMSHFPAGKLPAEVLAELLSKLGGGDERVIVPPGIGTDATAIAVGDRCLVAASDPITFATDEIGWYAVMVNANDVACLGAEPRWFLATVLLPEQGSDRVLVEAIFDQIRRGCEEVGATLCGGHTEITLGLERPIVSGMMLGECALEDLVAPSGVREGDAVIATKGIAIEGTAVLARELGERLRGRIPDDALDRMRRLLHEPGISVVPDARIARSAAKVHAMHDVTEGGIATALRELATAGNCGLEVNADAIHVLAETRMACHALSADPLGLLGSGCLLVAVARHEAAAVVKALTGAGIRASSIAHVTSPSAGVWVRGPKGRRTPLRSFDRDEAARLLG